MTSYTRTFGDDSIQATRLSFYALALSTDTTLTWPIELSDTPLADQLDVTPASAGLSITLPDARQASPGASTLMGNLGVHTFTVKDAAGATVTTVAAGAVKHVYLRTNATAAGTWGVVLFGATSSALTAADVDGYGLRADSGELIQTMPVVSVISSHTITAVDRAKLYLNTGGAITATLTAAATIGSDFFVAYRNEGSGDVTVTPSGADVVDGAASLVLSPTESCFLVCDGSDWHTIGLGQSTTFQYESTIILNAGSNITLSAAQYGKEYLRIEDTTGHAAITLTFPASFGIWFVDNVSSHAVTLASSGGGTTLSVASGVQYIMLCDSINMRLAHVITATAVSEYPAGTAAAPSIKFTGDTDTGIYSPGADQAGMATGGSAAMTWGSALNVSFHPLEVPAGASGSQAPRASEVHLLDATLTALAALSWSAGNQFPYWTAADTITFGTISATGLTLVAGADATAMRGTLGAAESGANSSIVSLSGLTSPLSVSQGGTAQTTLAAGVQDLLDAISTTQGTVLYRGAGDWAALAPGTSGQVLITGGAAADPAWGTISLTALPPLTPAGSSADFTSIPPGVKRITIVFGGVSTTGNLSLLVQIGDSGGLENTGYLGASSFNGSTNGAGIYTTGYGIGMLSAANILHGSMTITKLDSNTWVAAGNFAYSDSTQMVISGGSKTLSGTLDRVSIVCQSSYVFDAGKISVMYE